jgi:tetratricopeptide (TPR) repeat protein
MARGALARVAIGAGLVALVLAVFAGVREHEFVDLDDVGGIEGNADLDVDSAAEALRNAFTRPLLANWIPLTILSHQLDRRLYGPSGGAHQLTNVGLHAAATVLLFLALASLTGATARSAFVAAVFAVHPLHVETVAWVSERKGVLSGLFFTLLLLAYARHTRSPTPASRVGVYAALLAALLSKPTAVTFPFVLLLLDAWPLRRLSWQSVREKVPMFVAVAAISVVTLLVQRGSGAMAYGLDIDLGRRLANALWSYGVYLEKTFWPLELAVFYPFPKELPDPLASALLAAGLALATLFWVRLRGSHPYLLVGWLWWGGILVPTLGLVQVGLQAHADRYTYLPLVGLSIALVWGVADLARSPARRAVASVVGVALIAVLALVARQQVEHWRDSFTMWERVLEVTPNQARALLGIGTVHARLEDLDETERYYLAAWESDPEFSRERLRGFFQFKAVRQRQAGDHAGELESLERSLSYAPDHPESNLNLGLALARRGQLERARRYLARGLEAEEDDVRVLEALAPAAEASGRFAEALALRREIAHRAPERQANRNDLAWLLATAPEGAPRDPDEAVRIAEELVGAGEEAQANALDTLAAAYAAAGRFAEAVDAGERAVAAAREAGDAGLARAAGRRLQGYRQGRPYTRPQPEPLR